jgi:DNA polymerase III subunit delta'
MPTITNFTGNAPIREMLQQMAVSQRIPQSLLFCGPEGIGKATLARRFAALMLDHPERIEADDLSLPANRDRLEERLALASDKRAEDPLLFASHPDFLTFAPDGPLRQISIQQIRLAKEHAQFSPTKGTRRVFLLDELDRANEQAANSLLKILEEPPPYLLLIGTVTNVFDLLPTIRSRSVMLTLNRASDDEIARFLADKGIALPEAAERARLALGCPGKAISIDLAQHHKQADAMLALLEVSAGARPFGDWLRISEATISKKSENLEAYLHTLLTLLQDLLHLRSQGPLLTYREHRETLARLAARVDVAWVHRASQKAGEIQRFLRRNAQKTAALDDFAMELLQSGIARR